MVVIVDRTQMKTAHVYTGDCVNRHSNAMITLGNVGEVAGEITIVPNKQRNTSQYVQ